MLRASALNAGYQIDLMAVTDRDRDPNIPAGRELLDFTDALIGSAGATLPAAREALVAALGPEGAARTALVAGNFEMMNTLLDATGVPVPKSMGAISGELGLPPFEGR